MEAQLQPPRSHGDQRHEEDPHHTGLHSVVEGEAEHDHHGEKKSVLKKVKEKAKKIKHTIAKHGHEHEHGHEHDYRHDQISEEDDDENDDEIEKDRGIHGSRVHEPTVITGTKLPKQTEVNLDNPADHALEKRQPNVGAGVLGSSGLPNPNWDKPTMGTGGLRDSSLYNPNVDNPPIIGAGAHRPSGLHDPSVGAPILGTGTHAASGLHSTGIDTFNTGAGAHRSSGIHNSNVDTPNIGAGAQRSSGLHNPNVGIPSLGAGVHKPSGLDNPNVGADIHKPSDLYNPNVDTPNIGIGVHKPSGTSMAAESRLSAPFMAVGSAGRPETQDKGANVKIGPLEGLDKDPHSPKNSPQGIPPSNYQAKVTDPTGKGGNEADVDPLARRLDDMHVHDGSKLEPVPESRQPDTGTHDQFAPHGSPTAKQFKPGSNPDNESPGPMPVDTTAGKVSSAASVLASKAAAAKNMVASKLGYGDDQGRDSNRDTPEGTDRGSSEPSKTPITTPVDATAGKVSAATSVLEDKAAAAKNMVASKLGYGEQGGRDSVTDVTPNKGVTDTVTGKVSSAASVVADKAAAAKSQVASKLGYGDQGAGKIHDTPDTVAGKASSATSTLADKAAAAKNMVAAKLGYGDQGHSPIKGAAPEGSDKGLSVKEYLAEKLRPGDEDKALSSAITERLHKKEGATEEAPTKRATVITETLYDNKGSNEGPAVGKVTVSKEVAEQLGPKHENKREGTDATEAGMESTGGGGGMVDRLKDAVGSWLGKSSGTETAKNSVEQAHVSDAGDAQGRRLQESGN